MNAGVQIRVTAKAPKVFPLFRSQNPKRRRGRVVDNALPNTTTGGRSMRSAKRPESHPIRDGMAQALRGAGGIFTESSEAGARAVTAAVHEARKSGEAVSERIADIVK